MDLFLKISKAILDTNYKTSESLAEFLKAQFAILTVLQSDDGKKVLVKDMETLNSDMNKLRSEIQKMSFDKKRGRVIDESIFNKKTKDLKVMGHNLEVLKSKLSVIKHTAISSRNAVHNSKNELFISNVKSILIREYGREKQRSIFRECNVEMEQLSESITIN